MKTISLKRALEKAGLKVSERTYLIRGVLGICRFPGDHTEGRSYSAKGPIYSCSWRDNDGEADNVRVTPNNDRDDLQTDYFCGNFPKTIKSAVSWTKGEQQ